MTAIRGELDIRNHSQCRRPVRPDLRLIARAAHPAKPRSLTATARIQADRACIGPGNAYTHPLSTEYVGYPVRALAMGTASD